MLEFKVIVLAAGKGSRFVEMTTRKPKCLLPIGNNPMVYYPLKMIEKSDFKEVFLIVLESAESEVQAALEQTDLIINVNIITIPCDVDWGTADSLRHTASHFTDNIEQCDFIVTPKESNFATPGPKSKNKPERDLVGIDPRTNRLVFLASASDFEDQLPLKRALLYKHGHVRIYTKLLDAHFFVMKKCLVKYLTLDKNISTVKGELLPFALKMQMSPDNKLPSVTNASIEVTPVKNQLDKKNSDLLSLAKNVESDITARSMSSFNDHGGDLSAAYLGDSIKCYGFMAENELGLRTNTLREFCRANKLISQYWHQLVGRPLNSISSESQIESTQFEKETCFVGPLTTISSKTSISSSTFGRGCLVESKTKITDCIIMNNVKIKEGCTLSNCVICDDVTIETNCILKDCLIGNQYIVSADSSHANEILAEIASLMEV